MNLQEFLNTNPTNFKSHCLVFSPELAQILQDIQNEYGNKQHVPRPRLLINGKYVLGADLLTEVHPGGLYYAGWQHLPQERFSEVEVALWSNIQTLFPVEPELE